MYLTSTNPNHRNLFPREIVKKYFLMVFEGKTVCAYVRVSVRGEGSGVQEAERGEGVRGCANLSSPEVRRSSWRNAQFHQIQKFLLFIESPLCRVIMLVVTPFGGYVFPQRKTRIPV